MGDDYETNWSPEMIEPMYEDDIQTMIQEVNPQQLQSKFVRITDEQMPEILKFIDESNEYQFDDWAIIGESKGEDEESVPGSAEDPTSRKTVPKNLFSDADGLEVAGEVPAEDEEEEEEEAEEEEADDESHEATIAPPDNENSMVFSMFLTNWEDQVRQIRDAKRQEWQKKWQELLGPEEEEPTDEGEKSFVDDDGESWVLLDHDAPITAPAVEAPQDLQVALVQPPSQVARRTGFFEKWPSFNVGSKLGVVLTATGTSFAFGFMMGARAAMDSFYRLCERPLVAGVVGVTTAFAVSIQPTLLASAVKYIILGGVVGGTAVATPVFVVGTTGVFVSAAVYHSWILAKRGVTRTFVSSGPRSVASPLPALPPVPAKPIAVPLTHAPHHHHHPCCPAEDQKCV